MASAPTGISPSVPEQGEIEHVLLPGAAAAMLSSGPLEALLAEQGNFQSLLMPPDADDETMVELAIALSLQVIELISLTKTQ